MVDPNARFVGTIATLHRYPVKSMLGEDRDAIRVDARGVAGDRAWALLDTATRKVASAKRPKLWRGLLTCAARTAPDDAGRVEVLLPDGTARAAGDPELDALLSALTERTVRLAATPPDDPELDRAHPEAVLADGLDADVGSDILRLGASAPPGTFLDYAPLHLITTSTLDGITAALPDGPIEPARYRPNVVIQSPADAGAFPENAWIDGTLHIGADVALHIVLATPRCAIPTLAQGALPARPGALRAVIARNRLDLPGFGTQPCAGVYAAVLQAGTITQGDAVRFLASPAPAG